MRYSSVIALKCDIREALDVGSFLADTIDPLHLKKQLQVSLGVRWVNGNNYHLAVRVREGSKLVTEALCLRTKLLTKGEVDFRVTRRAHIIEGCAGSPAKVTTFNIGGSIGHRNHRGGTLGFFAKRRSDGAVGLVSANHVIALNGVITPPATPPDDEIVHPSLCDIALAPPATVARLDHSFPVLDKNMPATADCAFAVLEPGKLPQNPGELLGTGILKTTPVAANNKMNVFKIGRTTGKTAGHVLAFDLDTLIVGRYPFGSVHFTDQIEIESVNASPFSGPGDSGAIVFDGDNNPIGLLFAEIDVAKHHKAGLQYATPIKTVLDVLGVDILA
jgi:hypothetical protein